MNEWLQYIKEHIVLAGSICGIVGLIITTGIVLGYLVVIIAALIIAAAVIIGGYLVVIIRKKDDEIASLQEQIEQYENPEEKSSPDVCGTYDIVDAKNPQGEVYNGTLTIEKWNKWLSCKWVNHLWKNPPWEIDGIGLRVGKALAFSYKYTDSKEVDHTGVMHYMIKIDHLSGKCVETNELEINEPHTGFEECKKK